MNGVAGLLFDDMTNSSMGRTRPFVNGILPRHDQPPDKHRDRDAFLIRRLDQPIMLRRREAHTDDRVERIG